MSETRAAAERLVDKWNKYGECYPQGTSSDAYELARAYLAEHPADDGEAVDEAWLRSVGFDAQGLVELGGARLYLGAKWDGGTHTAEIQVGGGSGYYGCEYTVDLPRPQTRSDVRRLCAALGVELKEAT